MYCRTCGEHMNDNQVVCLKCGVEAGKGKSYCPNCGNAVHEEAVICVKCGVSLKKTGPAAPSAAPAQPANSAPLYTAVMQPNNAANIRPRSIATAIILSLVTCGIYAIFWFISLTNEINHAAGRPADTSGGLAFVLGLVTCGIYTFYWAYKMGEKRDIIAKENGSSNVVYLVLTLFGLGIVVYALLQDTLNKAIEKAA